MTTSIQTPRRLAQHGGWLRHTAASSVLLRDPYRNHLVAGRSSLDVYVLPPAMGAPGVTLGRGVPVGTVVWVHNVNGGGYAVSVRNSDGSFAVTLNANKSLACMLLSGGTAQGTWVAIASDRANGRGPTQPDGYRFQLELRRSQNLVHVLQAAIDDGYDGTVPALVTVRVHPNIVIGSPSRFSPALDFGGDVAIGGINWHAGSLIYLQNKGIIGGYGGQGGGGGIGGTGASTGVVGEDGGIGMRVPLNVSIENLGRIQGGGGGGGGGDGSAATPGLHGGPGGGGAGCNVDAAGVPSGGSPGAAATGTGISVPGSVFLGAPGAAGAVVVANMGGSGGTGGAPGASGLAGKTLNNAGSGSAGGAGGAAISRASGATITWIVNGVVNGATVVV